MNETKSQESQILEWLKAGNTITPLEALERFNMLRLGGRIFNLRKLGHDIKTEDFKTPSGKHVARYRLEIHHGRTGKCINRYCHCQKYQFRRFAPATTN